MTCEQLAALYDEYALGVLEGEERAEIEAHLARNCPTCTPGVAEARWMVAQLAHTAPAAQPSGALRNKIMEAVQLASGPARGVVSREQPKRSAPRTLFPAWAWVAAAALALIT
jgi:anti-sigma-K factor RskA